MMGNISNVSEKAAYAIRLLVIDTAQRRQAGGSVFGHVILVGVVA